MSALRKRKKGQAVVEYLLLVVVVATVTITFVNFLVQNVFRPGLVELPQKMERCVSTGGTGRDGCN